jgi:hypothetical protein
MLVSIPECFDPNDATLRAVALAPENVVSIASDKISRFGHESIQGKFFSRIRTKSGEVFCTWRTPDELAALLNGSASAETD